MAEGSKLIQSFLSAVESVAGSSISSSLATKLKVGSVVVGEGADLLEGILQDRIPSLPTIIAAGEKLVADAEQLEKDTEAFYVLVKSAFSSKTATDAVPSETAST